MLVELSHLKLLLVGSISKQKEWGAHTFQIKRATPLKDMITHIDDWSAKMKQDIEDFVKWWKTRQIVFGKYDYPDKMEPGDLDEQFFFFVGKDK